MSAPAAATATPPAVPVQPLRRRTGVGAVYRVELSKIVAQLLPRLAAAVCLLGPFAFAVFIHSQSSVPADTLFGRWVHTSGFAIPFVALGFAGVAGFPLLTSVVAGDIFAGEDGHGTWKTVLTRSRSRGDVFWGKCLAAVTFSTTMVVLLAVSSTLAGILVVGTQPLVGLSGQVLGAGRAVGLVAESFAVSLLPALAFTCLGIMFSVGLRTSMAGVLGPPVVGLLMLLLSLVGSGLIVRTLLLTTPFEAWHGLLLVPSTLTPLWIGALVCLGYAALSLDTARRWFRRRDFAGDGRATIGWSRVGRAAVAAGAVVAILAAGSAFDKTWITAYRLERSVGPTFRNLVVLQQRILGHAEVGTSLLVFPFCKRQSVVLGTGSGAGDDWDCHVFVSGPRFRGLGVDYTLTVKTDGCYTAEGPPSVIGPLHIRDRATGGTAINPLYAFDGCMIAP